jgi:hypothetical protein
MAVVKEKEGGYARSSAPTYSATLFSTLNVPNISGSLAQNSHRED